MLVAVLSFDSHNGNSRRVVLEAIATVLALHTDRRRLTLRIVIQNAISTLFQIICERRLLNMPFQTPSHLEDSMPSCCSEDSKVKQELTPRKKTATPRIGWLLNDG
jgi:hypothetical protein